MHFVIWNSRLFSFVTVKLQMFDMVYGENLNFQAYLHEAKTCHKVELS